LETLEQARPPRLLALEYAPVAPLRLSEGCEGGVQGLELGTRHLHGTSVEVAVFAQDREAIEDGAITGIELPVRAPVLVVEADGDPAGWDADGLAGDGF
jgi:hypothetical protein